MESSFGRIEKLRQELDSVLCVVNVKGIGFVGVRTYGTEQEAEVVESDLSKINMGRIHEQSSRKGGRRAN